MLSRFLPCALLIVSSPAAAQWSLSSHLATDGSLRGSPFVAGASLSSINDHVGVRMGFSLDASDTPGFTQQQQRPGGLTVDFDGMYYPAGASEGSGLAPYAFLGLGARESESSRKVLTGSYGSGVDLQLSRFFGIQAETRRRVPLNSAPEEVPTSGWEFRVGLSLRLAGARRPVLVSRPEPHPVFDPPYERSEPVLPPAIEVVSVRAEAAEETIATAESYLGVRYRWGGSSPTKGFDCSGFVQYVYRAHGVTLPRVSRDQAHAGADLPAKIDALEAGDLMFFASNGRRVDHVAIYVGDGRILHASKSRGAVGYDNLWSRRGAWFREHFVEARRVLTDGEAF